MPRKPDARNSDEGIPALKNDDVTGMSEDKQDEVIRESGQAPRRKAAKEFLDEQVEQAGETGSGEEKRP